MSNTRHALTSLLSRLGVAGPARSRVSPGSGASGRGPIAAPFVARSLIALCALAGLFALSTAAVAQAEPPKLIPYESFSTHEPNAVGVAVEGSGDLFVSSIKEGSFGFGPSTVVKLDPSGKLLSPPSPFGSSHYSGVAVNPTNGDVYLLGQESVFTPTTMIFVYDPNTGALLSSFEVPASHNWEGLVTDVQIAADSAGNVYVPVVPENKVVEYSPSGTLRKTFTGSGAGALNEPTGVAVDQKNGDLWVADAGNNRIEELDSSGTVVSEHEIKSEGVSSVALDAHGDVFALVVNSADPCGQKGSPCMHLVEYSAEGRQLADLGAGQFGSLPVGGGGTNDRFFSMVAVNQASERVYVLDGDNEIRENEHSKGRIWVFGPPTAPVVGRELTAEVGSSEVKLGALVNPGGIQTTYRFEYGPTGAYGSSTPFPEGSVGEGVTARAVWGAASGLAAGTTYHYRVVATNELAPGGIAGSDQTFTTLTAEQAACPNEQLRGGFSARLPDCRAYELVTAPVTSGSQFDAALEIEYASTVAADGEAVSLYAREPRPGAPTAGLEYVATRGAGGWLAEDVMPLESYDGIDCVGSQYLYAYSDQLTKEVMLAGRGSRAGVPGEPDDPESCNPEGGQVVSGEPVGYENLLVRENATGTYRLVNVLPAGVTPADAHFQAASADLSHVIFTETSPLATGASYGVENLYEWDEGALRLVSWLPDGTAVPGSLAAEADRPEHEGVSSDGSHVLFTYAGALYDRIDGQRTVQIDEKQGGPDPSGGGSFKGATSDGSKVFFLDERKLTPGSTAESNEPDLYECALGEGASRCELTDLTVATGSEHADVLSVTPLGPHDSAYVYFVAEGVLASNARVFTNAEGKEVVENAEKGQRNLYLWNGATTTFIASAPPVGTEIVEPLAGGQTSPDGKWLAFESQKSLTGYDNAAGELFLYSVATGQLACASCNPTGEPGGGVLPEGGAYAGAGNNEELHGVFRNRHLVTDAGRAFFQTGDALVPSDTNGQLDVYEYEGGHVYLISSGTSSFESNLEGASESGDDVFFRSNQQLVPQDTQEGQIVIYDARVAGGFAEPPSPSPCTTADACRTPVLPQPSLYGAPASQTFSGVGNLTPAPVSTKVKPKSLKCRKGYAKKKLKGRKKVKSEFRCVRKSGHKAKSHKEGK